MQLKLLNKLLLSFGGKFTSTLSRNGDLERLYLKVVLPAIPSCSTGSTPNHNELNSMAYWIPRVGHVHFKCFNRYWRSSN